MQGRVQRIDGKICNLRQALEDGLAQPDAAAIRSELWWCAELARAGLAAGVYSLFMECHPDPDRHAAPAVPGAEPAPAA